MKLIKMEKLKNFLKDEDGITGLEYSLLASLVIVVIVVFFAGIRSSASVMWSEISSSVSVAS